MIIKKLINILLKLESKLNGHIKIYYLDEYNNLHDIDEVKIVDIPFLGVVIVLKQEDTIL